MTTLIFIVVLIYIIFFIIGFISYAFNSYGLYELAKKEKENNLFIAWIPYINRFTLGRIAFKSNIQAILLVILSFVGLISSSVLLFISKSPQAIFIFSIISLVMSIISAIYVFIARYKVYKKYSRSTIIMTILDIISFGLLGPFFIFAIRENNNNN